MTTRSAREIALKIMRTKETENGEPHALEPQLFDIESAILSARREAIEECAKVAETLWNREHHAMPDDRLDSLYALQECYEKIRAITKAEEEVSKNE